MTSRQRLARSAFILIRLETRKVDNRLHSNIPETLSLSLVIK